VQSGLHLLQRVDMLPGGHDGRKCKAEQAGTRHKWTSVHCSPLRRHENMAWVSGASTRPGCMFAMISLLI
jgi:hypothetical protein